MPLDNSDSVSVGLLVAVETIRGEEVYILLVLPS